MGIFFLAKPVEPVIFLICKYFLRLSNEKVTGLGVGRGFNDSAEDYVCSATKAFHSDLSVCQLCKLDNYFFLDHKRHGVNYKGK